MELVYNIEHLTESNNIEILKKSYIKMCNKKANKAGLNKLFS